MNSNKNILETTPFAVACDDITEELNLAKQKHPVFAKDINQGLNIITEEYLEFVRAINDNESKDRIKEEAAHVIVTVTRVLEML